jgi:hypothetical protein
MFGAETQIEQTNERAIFTAAKRENFVVLSAGHFGPIPLKLIP